MRAARQACPYAAEVNDARSYLRAPLLRAWVSLRTRVSRQPLVLLRTEWPSSVQVACRRSRPSQICATSVAGPGLARVSAHSGGGAS